MAELPTVQFDAEVRQIKSMVDGSCNLIVNIPEYEIAKAQVLLAWLHDEVVIAVVNGNSNGEKR